MFREATIALLICLVLLAAATGCGPVSSSEAAGSTNTGLDATIESVPTLSAGESAETDLQATIEAPATLTTGDRVIVRFSLTNSADVALYVLKWYTPLEGIAGEIFRVERDGEEVPYHGILATRSAPSVDAYVRLEPGASASAEVDLATAYDFSQPGTYTITFISPRISHVAQTKSEMATSLDDLGPVQIRTNTIAVEIGGSAGLPSRETPGEAAEMVRDYLRREHPKLSPDVRLPMSELTVPEVWERLRVQVFRVTEGPFARETFLIGDSTLLQLGTAVGGEGVTSTLITDLDRDSSAELLFAYRFGSGLHQSRIGMYAPAYADDRIYEAETAYLGDIGLVKESLQHVAVRVVESDEESRVLRDTDALGHLTIQKQEGEVRLVLEVAADLPDDLRQNLVRTNARDDGDECPGWEEYVNSDYRFAFCYPPTWALEEETNLVKLSLDTLQLSVAFQRRGEEILPPWSGMPAGDFETRGPVTFLGREIEKNALVYQGKVKVLTYSTEVDELMFSMRLENMVAADYTSVDIPEAAQREVDQIVGSFHWEG